MRPAESAALVAPALSFVVVLFAAPMLLLFAVSFWTVKHYRLTPAADLAAWQRVLENYAGLLAYTLLIGAVVALLCTAIGFLFAYTLRFHLAAQADRLLLATMIALFGGYLVKVYAWKTLLSQDGLINDLLLATGLRDTPAPWLIFNRGAVIVTLVNFLLPFAILPIYAALRNVSADSMAAARDLGAGAFTTVWRVVLPQCRAGLFSAFAFSFLLAAGDYVTPIFLGGSNGSMLGQFVAEEFSVRFNWPAGAAMSFALLLASLLLLGGAWRIVAPRR